MNTNPSINRKWIRLAAVAAIGLAIGCSAKPAATTGLNEISVADFAQPTAPSQPQDPPEQVATPGPPDPTGGEPEHTGADTPTPATITRHAHADTTYTVDAMVGHVNGQPIYAGAVFDPIHEQLSALGQSRPTAKFREQATQLIIGRLQQLVVDALILGEAERNLTNQEQQGLVNLLAKRREEFIRFWGKGSVALAEDSLIRHTGRSLDETVTDTRHRMLVQRYLQQRLIPKINITRKDVERYYRDHTDEYNPPPARVLRLIRTEDPTSADSIDTMLKIGSPFAEVAATGANTYRRGDGGMMSDSAVGHSVFGSEALNTALGRLQPGEHSARITDGETFWWLYVESVQGKPARSLTDAQLEIEELLRRRRYQQLTQEYRRELIDTGSYSPIDQMGRTLLEITMARYAAGA